MAVEWTCEAYGENPYGLCFFDAFDTCKSFDQCAPRMWLERRQLWGRLHQLEEAGDETAVYLLSVFSGPDELLGGPAAEHTAVVDNEPGESFLEAQEPTDGPSFPHSDDS